MISRVTYLSPKMACEPLLVVRGVSRDLPLAQNGLRAIAGGPRSLA